MSYEWVQTSDGNDGGDGEPDLSDHTLTEYFIRYVYSWGGTGVGQPVWSSKTEALTMDEEVQLYEFYAAVAARTDPDAEVKMLKRTHEVDYTAYELVESDIS
jgi:hypothetical protein